MPFFVQHDGGLATLGALAGNVGLNATANQDFHNQLAANADYRAQSQQDFQQQQAQDSGSDSMYRTILGDVTQRDLSADRIQGQQDLAGLNNDEKTELEQLKEGAAGSVLTQKQIDRLSYLSQKDTDAASRQQTQIGAQTDRQNNQILNTGLQNDLKLGAGYNHDLARAQIEADREKARQDYANAHTIQQQKDAEDRFARTSQLAQIHAQIDLLKAQKKQAVSVLLNNARARMQRVSPIDIQNATAQYDKQIQDAIAAIKGSQRIVGAGLPDQNNPGDSGAAGSAGMPDDGGGQTYTDNEMDMTGMGQGMGAPGGGQSQPVQVQTRAQAISLPSGTLFIDPNTGDVRVRP
jgi:hypothetical protein